MMAPRDLFRATRRAAPGGSERPTKGITVAVRPPNADGVPVVVLTRLTCAGLAIPTAVADHRIERHFRVVVPHVRLVNGSAIRLVYAETDELLELSGEKVAVAIDPDKSIRFDLAGEKA